MTAHLDGAGASASASSGAESPEERRARWRSVAVSHKAMPTRKAHVASEWDRMTKKWPEEHDAARQLRSAGITPPTLADAPRMVQELND